VRGPEGWCINLLRSWKAISVIPDLIPRSREHLCFDCLASLSRYAGRRSLMDSSLDVRIAKNKSDRMSKPLSAIHHWPMWSWFPAKIAALGTQRAGASSPVMFSSSGVERARTEVAGQYDRSIVGFVT
jgi:hypothetical protein